MSDTDMVCPCMRRVENRWMTELLTKRTTAPGGGAGGRRRCGSWLPSLDGGSSLPLPGAEQHPADVHPTSVPASHVSTSLTPSAPMRICAASRRRSRITRLASTLISSMNSSLFR